jgi:hypothetical protein
MSVATRLSTPRVVTVTAQHDNLPIADAMVERSALKCPERIACLTSLLQGTVAPHALACQINDYLIDKVFATGNGTVRDFATEYKDMAQFIVTTTKHGFYDPLPATTTFVADILIHKAKLLRARKGSGVTVIATKSRQQVIDESMAYGQSFSAKGQRGVSQN